MSTPTGQRDEPSGQGNPDEGKPDESNPDESNPDAGTSGTGKPDASKSDEDGKGKAGDREPGHSKQPEMLEYGDEGPKVRALQRQLKRLHYDPGEVDGVFGTTTRYALWAFQKVNGLEPDGVVGPKTRAALADPQAPKPLEPGHGKERVEIDLSEQLLYVYQDGKLALISHISSGSEDSYCTEDGHCGDAVTPSGEFEATWRVNGWRESNLGRLYNPVYFASGGFAVHGSPSVPLYPASHGCVRIPMHTATIFPDLVEPGEPFYVE